MNKDSSFSYILFAYFGLFSLAIMDNSRGPIYPEILQVFNISSSYGSLIFSLSSLMSFIITIFANKWSPRLGAVNSVKFALFLHLIAILLMGTSGKYSNGYSVFLFASCIFGIGVGMMSISLNLIVTKFSPVLKRRKYFAGLHSMYGLASCIAPVLVSYIFKCGFDWQNLYLLFAVFPLSLLLFGTKLPKQGIANKPRVVHKFSWKLITVLGLIFSFYISSEIIVSSRLALFLRTVWHFDASFASQNVAIFFLLLLSGRMVFAIFHIHICAHKLLMISSSLSFLSFVLGLYVHPYFLVTTGLTMSFFFPNALEWVSQKYDEHADFLITQIMMFVGAILVIAHWAFGALSDLTGIQNAMHIGPIMLILVVYLLHTQR